MSAAIVDGCRVALVLAGGNALGAYQAGVYQALHEGGVQPDWVVGASIGAINGAIIAGSTPERRLPNLTELWRPADREPAWPMWWDAIPDVWRRTGEALGVMLAGRPGVFAPLGTSLTGAGGAAPAIYDTEPLRATLSRLVDFDRLNSGPVRYAATAVDLQSGEDVVFDTVQRRVSAEHIRASAALPPTFPPVPIGDRVFVDAGVSANLPLDPVLSAPGEGSLLCIGVDLLPEAAAPPRTLGDMIGRAQDLIFACQSRRTLQRWREAYAADAGGRSVTVVRLAYADQAREVAGKGMDFSPASVRLRWDTGLRDGRALIERLVRGDIPIGLAGLTVA
jgi:NTE family protein